jgi:hypothetical protein
MTRSVDLPRDGGSALLLVPSGLLVLLLLSALVLDGAVAYLAQREVSNVASSAANDLATLALDPEVLHRDGRVELDPVRMADAMPYILREMEQRMSGAVHPDSLRIQATLLSPTEVLLEVTARPTRVVLPAADVGPSIVRASAIGRIDRGQQN